MTVSKVDFPAIDQALAMAKQETDQLKFFSVMTVLLFVAAFAFGTSLQALALFLLFMSFVSATVVVHFVWSASSAVRAIQIERNLQIHQQEQQN